MKKLLSPMAVIAGVFLWTSCQKDVGNELQPSSELNQTVESNSQLKNNTFKGPQVPVGDGKARSFITISHTGVPQEIGLVFTDDALSGLPDINTPYVLQLHPKALEATPFDHIALGWSANGHPLPGSFIAPHFDVRFFMMSLQQRLAIPAPPAAGFLNLPPSDYMPSNYAPDAPVPMLGLHWTDESFVAGVPVNHTLILGTWDGAFTFVSPIVTRTQFLSGQSVSIAYAQPQLFAERTYYPTKYNVYKDEKEMHYVSLSDFVLR
jgi:hypothetical protein